MFFSYMQFDTVFLVSSSSVFSLRLDGCNVLCIYIVTKTHFNASFILESYLLQK